MTRLVSTRGRAIAVLTILVASVLLTWVGIVVLGSHGGGHVRPGIDITTPPPAPTDTATPAPPQNLPPVEQDAGAPEPVPDDAQVPAQPAAPAATVDDDHDHDDDHDTDHDHDHDDD